MTFKLDSAVSNFFTNLPPTSDMVEGSKFPNVPQDIRAWILPDRDMSVVDFLKFPLPIVSCSPVTDPQKYLSPLSPTITNLKTSIIWGSGGITTRIMSGWGNEKL